MQSLHVYGKIFQEYVLLLTGINRGILGDQNEANSESVWTKLMEVVSFMSIRSWFLIFKKNIFSLNVTSLNEN